MSDVILNSFPSSKAEALAMLYLQNQDIKGLTPEELFEKYEEAFDRIRLYQKETTPNHRYGWTKK